MYSIPSLAADPNPPDFPSWLHWLHSCLSTNTWAIAHAANLAHGAVVFTRHQTAGRGQHGRTWHSPPGVVTASFVLDLPRAQLTGLSLVVGLAVIHTIEELLPQQQGQFRLKWANDVLFEGRKAAGILCEAASRGSSEQTRVVVGIGLNRCVDFAQAGLTHQVSNAISLHQISDSIPSEILLLERLRHHLLQMSNLAAVLPQLQQRDQLRDRRVKLELNGDIITGRAIGLDSQGRLLLQLPNGQVQAFVSGRVVWWDED